MSLSIVNALRTNNNHSPKAWLRAFGDFSKEKQSNAIKDMRVVIIEQTMKACEALSYSVDGKQVTFAVPGQIKAMIASLKHIKYNGADFFRILRSIPKDLALKARISVVDEDCLHVAQSLVDVAVLNLASPKRYGGGFMTGAGAQEENLFRRTTLSLFTSQAMQCYPMRGNDGLFQRGVLVIRGRESDGYPFLPHPYPIDVITVAAISNPALKEIPGTSPTLYMMLSDDAERMKNKIRTVFSIAVENRCRSLVLGAMGCGAFKCPPNHVASIFHEVAQDYLTAFEAIVFAIFDDHNSRREHNPNGNFEPFRAVFEGTEKEKPETEPKGREKEKEKEEKVPLPSKSGLKIVRPSLGLENK